RYPRGRDDEVAPDAVTLDGALVLHHHLALGLLGLPSADGGRPADQRNLVVAVLRVEGEHRPALDELRRAATAARVGEVVPDVAAVHFGAELHVLGVVGRHWRKADGDAQRLGGVGGQRLEEAARALWAGPAERLGGGLGRGGEEIGRALGQRRVP